MLYLCTTPLHNTQDFNQKMQTQQRLPFKKTKTFKVLVLCVYVYSCVQLDPFDGPINIIIEEDIQAQEYTLEDVLKTKLKNLILAAFQD